jgi:hypothetical protein
VAGEETRTVDMGRKRKFVAKAMGLGLILGLIASVGVPGVSGASGPAEFPQCPAAGPDTGCGALITVQPDGTATVAVDTSQPALDGGTGVLVGVVNASNATVTNIALSGPGTFALGGKGVCTVRPSPCFSPTEFGPTGYEGPGTSLVPSDASDGTLVFSGGMSSGGTTYFSLSGSPVSVTALDLTAGIAVTGGPVAASTTIPFTNQVATFDAGSSMGPVTDFTAEVDWGDGTSSAGTVTQPDGPGTSYVVDGSHTYATAGNYTDTITVTDTVMTAIVNAGTATGAVTVTTLPVDITPAVIPSQLVGTPFSGPVATFTSQSPTATPADFTVSLDWGDGTSGTGTVTQPDGPGGSFLVTGSTTYATSGDFSITVSVVFMGLTTTGSVPIHVDASQVVVGCTSDCEGGTTTPLQSSDAKVNSTTGSFTLSLANGSLLCSGGEPYQYAPQITTVVTAGIPSNKTVEVKVSFLRSELQGPAGAPVEVCFEGNQPFVQLGGTTTPPTLIDGQVQYVGLLPACQPTKAPYLGPCLGKVSKPVPGWKHVVEHVKFPAGDPKFR